MSLNFTMIILGNVLMIKLILLAHVSFSCLAGKSDLNMDYAWLMRKKLVSPLVDPVSFSLLFSSLSSPAKLRKVIRVFAEGKCFEFVFCIFMGTV